jgi:hypothetical protein
VVSESLVRDVEGPPAPATTSVRGEPFFIGVQAYPEGESDDNPGPGETRAGKSASKWEKAWKQGFCSRAGGRAVRIDRIG